MRRFWQMAAGPFSLVLAAITFIMAGAQGMPLLKAVRNGDSVLYRPAEYRIDPQSPLDGIVLERHISALASLSSASGTLPPAADGLAGS